MGGVAPGGEGDGDNGGGGVPGWVRELRPGWVPAEASRNAPPADPAGWRGPEHAAARGRPVQRLVPARPQSRAGAHGARRSQAARGQGRTRHEDDLRLRVRGAGRSRGARSLCRRWGDPVDPPAAVRRTRQNPAAARPVRQAPLVASDAPAWALALLREARVGRLATADADGRPLVVPVRYALDADGQRLYSAIDAKPKRTRQLRRLRNIRENPQVSVVVDQY